MLASAEGRLRLSQAKRRVILTPHPTEFARLIASMPTALRTKRQITDGAIGEYVECFYCDKQFEDISYEAGLNGNEPRRVTVSIPINIEYESIDLYVDGARAEEDGTDYQHISIDFTKFKTYSDYQIDVDMAAGGGYLMVIKGKTIPVSINGL